VVIAVFGLLSAVANNYGTLLAIRVVVGMGIGGLTIPFDTMAEYLPQTQRGTALLSLSYFWTFGILLVVLSAYVAQQNFRLLLVLCAIPCILSTLVAAWFVPESPRWLLAKGRSAQALDTLRRAAHVNGHPDAVSLFPLGMKLKAEEPEVKSFAVICSPQWGKLFFFLSIVWAGFGLLYYATIMLVTDIFAQDPAERGEADGEGVDIDYEAITMSVVSEFVGLTVVMFTIDRFGRVASQVFTYFSGGICVLLLCLFASADSTSRNLLVVLAFGSRLFMSTGSCVTWTHTAEVLTTEIRTTGHSFVNSMARVTGVISPFIVQGGLPYRTIGVILFIASILTTIASFCLPETRGIALGTAMSQDSTTAKERTGTPNSQEMSQSPATVSDKEVV